MAEENKKTLKRFETPEEFRDFAKNTYYKLKQIGSINYPYEIFDVLGVNLEEQPEELADELYSIDEETLQLLAEDALDEEAEEELAKRAWSACLYVHCPFTIEL